MRYGYGRYPRKVLTGTVSRICGWEKKRPRQLSQPTQSTQSESSSGCTTFFLLALGLYFLYVLTFH
jgi:hypothetical protein